MNSILAISPGNTRAFDMEIASALGNINAAVIVQQLHYWMQKEGVGTIIEGVKYVYNTFDKWVREQFQWLSVWQFRKSMNLLRKLEIVKVIKYKSKQWNQTNYYSLDYDRLSEILKPKNSQSTENSDLCATTNQDERNQQIEVRFSNFSNIETKSTIQKEATNSKETEFMRSHSSSNPIAAAPFENDVKGKIQPKEINTSQAELNGLASSIEPKSEPNQRVATRPGNLAKCSINVAKKTKIVNQQWRSRSASPKVRSLIEELEGIGVPINKTLMSLVKMYSEEEVKSAIALLKIRKRDKHIPNPGGYFTSALKGNWAASNLDSEEDTGSDALDKGTVFRLWYDLAKELGYCTGQEIRDGGQWVCLSGTWEKWEDAMNRGYSLEYLKGVMKRNKGS